MRRLYLNTDNTPYHPVPKVIGSRIAVDMEKNFTSLTAHASHGVISLSDDNKPVPISVISDTYNIKNFFKMDYEHKTVIKKRLYVELELARSEHSMKYTHSVTEEYYEFTLSFNGFTYTNRYYYTQNYDTSRMIRFDVNRAIDFLLKIGKYNRFIYINPVIDSRYMTFNKMDKMFTISNSGEFIDTMQESQSQYIPKEPKKKSFVQKILGFIR